MKKLFLALLSIALFSSTSAYAAKAQLVKSTPAEGSVNAAPLPVPVTPITIYMNENQLQPQYVSSADGLVAGITQVNLQIPVGTYPSSAVNIYMSGAQGPLYIGH